MISDIYELDRLSSDYRAIPAEAEKVALYNGLDKKRSLRLRLLAEEMICMLPQLLIYGTGRFWIENEGNAYELHLNVEPFSMQDADREKIIDVSTNKKNAAAVGIIGKICDAVEIMLSNRAKLYVSEPYDFYSMGAISMNPLNDEIAWSLTNYRNAFDSDEEKRDKAEAWDELEKSIIANLADDVIVGVMGGKVEITVKKVF
ncbi:hypothetical protein [uncultured Ruminococcus sp.]|uniref:hypothetical protein n=1 Tax=uncultured Ruminococcus sp. TaxID=165186 RepID=UPI0025EB98D1|nr:hypothetical protein [uncultured Ruminococcus sp.]